VHVALEPDAPGVLAELVGCLRLLADAPQPLDEGEPRGLSGTYLAGFFESYKLDYGERGFGWPEDGQTVVPVTDGKLIRLPIPQLTEERRKELSRHVHKLTEEGRNSVRQVRRDANERLKKLLKDHKISEDDERKGLDEVQKVTDNFVRQLDDLQKKKDTELLGK